jgi:DNA repair protein RadC
MRNKVTWKQRIAEGGLNSTTVDMRKLFAPAIEHRAVSIAVAHNHPSGNLSPSKEDKALTQSIIEAGKILNIRLIDHLVVGVTPNGVRDYYSFTDNALM